MIFRAIFVRKKPRHQSALAYALAKAEVEELKPGVVLSQRTKRTPFMQEMKSETDCLNLHSESHFVQTFLLQGHVSDSYMSHKNCNLYSYSIYEYNNDFSSTESKKRPSAGKLLPEKLYQVIPSAGGSRQLLASHFTFDPAQGACLQLASNQSRDISRRKKKETIFANKNCLKTPRIFFIMCVLEEQKQKKRHVFYVFVCAFFGVVKLLGFSRF